MPSRNRPRCLLISPVLGALLLSLSGCGSEAPAIDAEHWAPMWPPPKTTVSKRQTATPESIAVWEAACPKSDSEACFDLARAYAYGVVVAPDKAKAEELFVKACGGKIADECVLLGSYLLQSNRNVSSNVTDYLIKACDASNMEACAGLGWAYDRGYGVPRHFSHAIDAYEKACTGGVVNACFSLSHIELEDPAFADNKKTGASVLYSKCTLGDPAACHHYGILLLQGVSLGRNPLKAVLFFHRGCQGQFMESCSTLAGYYLGNYGGGVSDAAKGAALYSRACENDDIFACYNLALLYRDGVGVLPDIPQAMALLKAACANNIYKSCDELAQLRAK